MEDDGDAGKWAVAVGPVNKRKPEPKKKHVKKVDKIIKAIEIFGKFGLPAIYIAFNVIFFIIGMAASK